MGQRESQRLAGRLTNSKRGGPTCQEAENGKAESSSLIDRPAIHAHPDGPAASARAFRQAIDDVMQGIKVSDYAEEHEELKTALTKWGGGRTGFQM